MRIAVVADIHGNLAALDAVLADMAGRAVDTAINLGDCVSGPLWPAETARRLMDLGWPTVRGNHDRWVAERPPGAMGATDRFAHGRLAPDHLDWLRALPPSLAPAAGIEAFHGTPDDDDAYLLESVEDGRLVDADEAEVRRRLGSRAARLVLCGHSHRPGLVQVDGGPLVLNPGSVGCPAYVDTVTPAHRSEARSPHARYAIVAVGATTVEAEFRALAYDWGSAADVALRNGRPDWAHALRTGFAREP